MQWLHDIFCAADDADFVALVVGRGLALPRTGGKQLVDVLRVLVGAALRGATGGRGDGELGNPNRPFASISPC